jgi:DNA-binding MarR family transcriptional regulator
MADESQGANREAIAALRQQHIGRLLLNAHRNYSQLAFAKLGQRGHGGLSLAHMNLFPHLDLEGTRITTLAERMGVSKQAIGAGVAELEARGYLRREVDPDDRRAAVITFTETGWRFLQDSYEIKREIEAEYAAILGAEGLNSLRDLLLRILHHSDES